MAPEAENEQNGKQNKTDCNKYSPTNDYVIYATVVLFFNFRSRPKVQINETPVEHVINIRTYIITGKEYHKKSGQDQYQGQKIVFKSWLKSLSQIILGHLLTIIQQQKPLEIIHSIHDEAVRFRAHPVLLYGRANAVHRYQLEEVLRCVLSSIFLKTVLNIPESLTLRQSLEMIFWFVFFWHFPSGSI